MESNIRFGKSMLSSFMFEPGYISVNSGSYGSCPREVLNKKREWQDLMYGNQERWQRQSSQEFLKDVRERVSQEVKAPFQNVFIVENSSVGDNVFLKSFQWSEGDTILVSNVTFKSVYKTLDYLVQTRKIQILEVKLQKKTLESNQNILRAYKQVVQKQEKPIKLALIDHVSSTPSIVFPVEQLSSYFHSQSIPFFIDGAHAYGQVEIDIAKLKPTGYAGGFHKWGFAPTSAAFLYVQPEFMTKIYPLIIANFHNETKDREFFWQGTRDISNLITVPYAMDYLAKMKKNGMDQYCTKMLSDVTNYLSNLFQTEPLFKLPSLSKFMNNIQLPMHLPSSQLAKISHDMLEQFNFYPMLFNFSNRSYWRISAQVFTELSDFEFAGQKLKQLFSQINKMSRCSGASTQTDASIDSSK